MSDEFDPYQKWLGIQPKDQPPHYYRLLGIELFESDADTIENAADQRMTHLRQFQTGPHAEDSQRLLNEVSAARVCLLEPGRKQAYDDQLRAELQPAPEAPAVPTPVVVAPLVEAPLAEARRIEVTAPSRSAPQPSGPTIRATPAPRGRKPAWQLPALLGGSAVLVAVVVVLIALSSSNGDATDDDAATGDAGRGGDVARGDDVVSPTDVTPAAEVTPPPVEPAADGTGAGPSAGETRKPPLTAGSNAAGEPVDLLGLIDVDRDATMGKWFLRDGALRNSNITTHGIRIPYNPPAEYDLLAEVKRTGGNRGIIFHLVMQGRRVSMVVDGAGRSSGLAGIDGKPYDKTPYRAGKLLSGIPRTLVCQVRRTGVRVLVDDEQVIHWQGTAAQLAEPAADEEVPLSISSNGAVFFISKLQLVPVR